MKRATLSLGGLRAAPPQSMGAVRLVPLLREQAPGDLRVALRRYRSMIGVVGLDAEPEEPGLKYIAYIPHGLVVSYDEHRTSAAFGATLGEGKPTLVQLHHRMVKGEAGEGPARFRLLPLHLAMEGFLALHFSGPTTLWSEYSQHARRRGLDPRIEWSLRGIWLPGLAQALAVFEIHPQQVGVLVFVAEALASALVVSHPDDYHRMHRTLLEDFFGDELYAFAMLHPELPPAGSPVDPARLTSFAEVEREIARVRGDWAEYAELLLSGLFGREVTVERVRELGPFELERFLPKFDPAAECHIGERIVRDDGTLEYLKTYRLSRAQVRRAYLLEALAREDWHLASAAAALSCSRDELITRLVNAGLGYLLKPHLVKGLSP